MESPPECGGGQLWMARPTAHLRQHLLQLPKLVHVNQCYIPGIETAYTQPESAFLLGSLHMFLIQWEEKTLHLARCQW